MSLDSNESAFERALRADLPSAEQEQRMRQRMLLAGLAVGAVASSSGAAAAAQGSWSATLVTKVLALSWPATLVLSATVAAPLVAIPLWLAPESAAPAPLHAQPPARSKLRVAPRPAVGLSREPAALAGPEVAVEPGQAVQAAPEVAAPEAAVGSAVAAREPAAERKEPSVAPRAAEGVTSEGAPALLRSEPSAVAAFDSAAPREGSGDAAPTNSSKSSLAAETQLLDRAFSELAAGHPAAAATLISEHERLFPNGLLRQERERARSRLNQDRTGE